MTRRADDNRFLNRIFLAWLTLAGGLSLFWPETRLDVLLGHRAVWTLVMPGACLVVLNPRRAAALALALLLALVWGSLLVARRLNRVRAGALTRMGAA